MNAIPVLLRMSPVGRVLVGLGWWFTALVLIEVGIGPVPAAAIAALLVLALLAAGRPPPADSHGSARFASAQEIDAAGFTSGTGLVLGRDLVRRVLLCMPAWAVHYLCVAPTGSGKNVSVIVPTLQIYPGPVLVLDVKGENFALCAGMRRALGRQPLRLDIWGAVSGDGVPPAARFNPLDLLDANSAFLVDDARALAVAVVLREPNEHQRFFNDMATIVLHLLILFVATHGEPGARHWGSVVALAKTPPAFAEAVAAALASPAAGGALAELAGSVSYLMGGRDGQRGSEFHSVLSTLMTHLTAFESSAVKASFSETTFDPAGLRRDIDLFLCFDAARLESHQAIPRIWLTALLQFLINHPRGEKVLVIADEIAQLGRLPVLETALTLLRSYGIKLAVFVQAQHQLARMFPADQGKTALANFDVCQYFSVNDSETATAVSQRLGASTVFVATEQHGRSQGTSGAVGQPETVSGSANWGTSHAPHERPLARPEEAFLLGDKTLIFARGRRPVLAKLLRFFDDPAFAARSDRGWLWVWTLLAVIAAALALAWWRAHQFIPPPV